MILSIFLAQETLLFEDIRNLLTQQFNCFSSLERQVMYWLAINREAVTVVQLRRGACRVHPKVAQIVLNATWYQQTDQPIWSK